MLKIAGTDLCNGCHACFSICPVHAITMTTDSEGFLRPFIDTAVCTKCGMCEKTCPVLHKTALPYTKPEAYACYNTNENIRMQSSSGGIFSLLAQKILSENGIVFGARFSGDFSVAHGWTECMEGLADFRGSKYVQSTIGSSFTECKHFLETGRRVLFSGTPCQIVGLLHYLGKPYKNLLCVDFICHGVPSPALWKRYCEFREIKAKSKIVRTSFRCKDCGWEKFSLAFTFRDASEYRATLDKDPYIQMFLRNVCLRPSCYKCSFKTVNRVSDITLADFWGIQNIFPDINDNKGISLVLVQSDKGKKEFNFVDTIFRRHVDCNLAVKNNTSIQRSVIMPKKRHTFFTDLREKKFQKIIKKYSRDSFFTRISLLIKRILRKVKKIICGVTK